MLVKRKGPTPIPSEHSSRSSFERDADNAASLLEKPTHSHAQSKIDVCFPSLLSFSHLNDRQALVRDGYACVISRNLHDAAGDEVINELRQRFPDHFSNDAAHTQACHIIPRAIHSDIYMSSVDALADNDGVISWFSLHVLDSTYSIRHISPRLASMGCKRNCTPRAVYPYQDP